MKHQRYPERGEPKALDARLRGHDVETPQWLMLIAVFASLLLARRRS